MLKINMIKTLFLLTALSLLFTSCMNKRGISAKYYSDCNEYYDLQGYYHKDCDEENMITYKEMSHILDKKEEPKEHGNVW